MLEAHGLTKRYGAFLALDHVDFQVRRGEILGYLGPNGSGKSTTVNTIVGLLEPSEGAVTLDGRSMTRDPVAYRRGIGYVPEEPHLYTHLTAVEYLTLVGGCAGCRERRGRKECPRCCAPAAVGQPLQHDDRVVQGDAAAGAAGRRADARSGSARPRRAVLWASRHRRPAVSNAARHVLGQRRMVLFAPTGFDIVGSCVRALSSFSMAHRREHDVAALMQPGSPSLEDVFMRSHRTGRLLPRTRQILDVMRCDEPSARRHPLRTPCVAAVGALLPRAFRTSAS